ncbi:MAG: hypothetical protein B6I38_01935 [Anaerolineaceae bacterium 4572_5.1]|nr:MAG: hypothetical protein B6I38_01935 [Anaerolineaceae bacterium 4572_5.1]
MKSWSSYLKQFAIAIGVVLLIILVMDYNIRLDELNRLNEKATIVRAQATQAIQTQVALQTQIAEATSDRVTEDNARNNGEIQEGDQRVVPIPATGVPPLEISVPTPVPTRVKKWQVWMELFFGE